jgi:hypothetical protein
MKFDYYSEKFGYTFNFSLTEDEIRKCLHKRGLTSYFVYRAYGIFPPTAPDDYKIFASTEIIRDALSSDKVDLGVDYKKKYEELVELLEPHRIDDMPPATTLKMLLKYNK